jgi:hypothetical protein
MGFQVYEKGSAPISTVPSVTIQKRGLISVNKAAYDALGAPKGVELLWDPDRRAIALRPAQLTNQNAYPLRAQGSHSEKGPWLVAGTLFTQFIGLDTSQAYRWTPAIEDGLLVVDISKPGNKVSSPRGRAKAATDKANVATEDESVTT